jgi:hypothetical protein
MGMVATKKSLSRDGWLQPAEFFIFFGIHLSFSSWVFAHSKQSSALLALCMRIDPSWYHTLFLITTIHRIRLIDEKRLHRES